VRWRNTALIGARAVTGVPDTARLQSVNMVPFVGDDVIVIAMEDGHIMLPGGTREEGESLLETISREMREETGCAIDSCRPFLVMECISYDEKPWRPWLVHPEFERLVCLGDVHHIGPPENPTDAEQIAHVHVLAIDEAIRFLRDADRPELADVYAFAGEMRRDTSTLIDLAVDDVPV
jgi:8-oxo-dGTP pyrophosphatase MutT (NUDIX family)